MSRHLDGQPANPVSPEAPPPTTSVDNYFLLADMNKSIGRIEQAVAHLDLGIKKLERGQSSIEGRLSKLDNLKYWLLGATAVTVLIAGVLAKPLLKDYSLDISIKREPEIVTPPAPIAPPTTTKTK